MKCILFFAVSFLAIADSFTILTVSSPRATMLSGNKMPGEMQTGDNPCWQDLYDDDCSMESVYAANFIASEWIKGMPCAAGIEDCDMPEELKVPEAKVDGIASVDVMSFLGLQRASASKPIDD